MLEVKIKNLDRREWYSDADRDFTCIYHKDELFDGGIGLITFTGIGVPDEVDTDEGRLCIADKGYEWLELAPKDGNFVVTAMFYEEKLFQIYIDITRNNEVFENGDALFYDLFLDVVINQKGQAAIIDNSELEEALEQGVISEDDFENAGKNAEHVAYFYNKNRELVEKKLYEYLSMMKFKDVKKIS